VAKKSPTEASESVWPHLIVGFVLAAGAAAYGGAEGSAVAAVGGVGAVLGFVLHNRQRPQVQCWWPGWWWLPPGLKGCRGRATTVGKYYGFKRPCPLHPQTSYYIRPVARLFGWGGPKKPKER
jgi:hypothetical protein